MAKIKNLYVVGGDREFKVCDRHNPDIALGQTINSDAVLDCQDCVEVDPNTLQPIDDND